MARYFLTALGTVNYDEKTYELENKTWRSRFAPVATARLTAITEGRALVLATQAVRDGATFPLMRQELTESGLIVDTIETADRIDATALLELLTRLGESVPAGSELTLDVTYGLRHLPFEYHAALLFLTGLKEAHVAGIYYGARELQGSQETVPLIDLTPTLRLIQWFSGLRALRDYGDARELANLFRGEVAQLFQAHSGSMAIGQVKDAALALGRNLALGLPLETGLAASNLRRAVAGADRNALGLSAMRMMAESVEPIASTASVRKKARWLWIRVSWNANSVSPVGTRTGQTLVRRLPCYESGL